MWAKQKKSDIPRLSVGFGSMDQVPSRLRIISRSGRYIPHLCSSEQANNVPYCCLFFAYFCPAPSYLINNPPKQVWQTVVPMVSVFMCGPGRQVRLTHCSRAETGKTHQLLETCEPYEILGKGSLKAESWSWFWFFSLPYIIGSRWFYSMVFFSYNFYVMQVGLSKMIITPTIMHKNTQMTMIMGMMIPLWMMLMEN